MLEHPIKSTLEYGRDGGIATVVVLDHGCVGFEGDADSENTVSDPGTLGELWDLQPFAGRAGLARNHHR